MTNFDFLTQDNNFKTFSGAAIAAENVFTVDIASSIVMCRRALELAIKWMYSVDASLEKPYEETLAALMHTNDFRNLIKSDLFNRINFIRKVGNNAAHSTNFITKGQALLALENLFYFMDFIAYCYGTNYQPRTFDRSIIGKQPAPPMPPVVAQIPLEVLLAANKEVALALTNRREEKEPSYTPVPIDPTEAETRKAYIDVMLAEGGWIKGKNWQEEVPIQNMPNASGEGFADYVLYADDGRPLAVIEAKKTSANPAKGRQQAKLYADDLERRYGRRPVIFLTNGYDTRIWIDQEGGYPERKISNIYGKRDLEKLFSLLAQKQPLDHILIDDNITNRYYQKEAIKAVCETFGKHNRRKALLVMATGSGKTRTVISLVKTLMDKGWIRNFLFLADRTALVKQAIRSFVNLLPDISVTNLCESNPNLQARGIFSTYPTMMNCIDESKDDDGNKIFTCGHFDLIIVDEAHRSIYKKYQSIFNYFDGLLVGLTATPKSDIDRNTYDIFGLEEGVPTYGYELAQAVKDKFLVDYKTFETKLKFLSEGIVYDELSESEKQEYEEKFADEDGNIPECIGGSALNEWVFNKNTILQVLNDLMTKGFKIGYGMLIGKSIIFAKNHLHAEKILEVFNKEYPNLPSGFCRVIDNYTNYSQSLIDDFSKPNKMPQIAISVDMLDTGIDIPEILNLVFFKKVMSKAKFWQMIGRGTRLCPGLLDGEDKTGFYIFDYCSNFEFFQTDRKDTANINISLQEQLFKLKLEIAHKLQDLYLQDEFFKTKRAELIESLHNSIKRLNRDNFAVRQHLQTLDRFINADAFNNLTDGDIYDLSTEIAPLVLPEQDDFEALRFDALIYGIELAQLRGLKSNRPYNDLRNRVEGLLPCGNIEKVQKQKDLIDKILNTDYLSAVKIPDLEEIRIKLRDLMRFVVHTAITRYETNFTDYITGYKEDKSHLETVELANYKKKAEHFLREHRNLPAIAKLTTNEPLSKQDIDELEDILWNKLGTKDNYIQDVGEVPLGEFVRSILGLDITSINEAFSRFIDENDLNPQQIYFVRRIKEYISQNGVLKDMSILQQTPFTDMGSVVDLFSGAVWGNISKAIDNINQNAIW